MSKVNCVSKVSVSVRLLSLVSRPVFVHLASDYVSTIQMGPVRGCSLDVSQADTGRVAKV